jgi:hypothetical protein
LGRFLARPGAMLRRTEMLTMAKTISSSDDLIDVRDIIERVEELCEEQSDFEGDHEGADWADANPDEASELATLQSLLSDLKGNGGDHEWEGDWYPVTLIRDSYFEDYARELVEDCVFGNIPKEHGLPAWIEIDWEATARNVRVDYSAVEFEGSTYWYR